MKSNEMKNLPEVDDSVKFFIEKDEFYRAPIDNNSSGPLISVVITTFNRSGLLERAIESIQIQTYSNIELIVIDDKSTDPVTRKILKKWEKNLGFLSLSMLTKRIQVQV